MLISDNRKQIRNDRSDHQANRHYLIAVILFALVFFSSPAYATEGNSSHDHNASSNTTNTINSSLQVNPDTNLSVAFLMKGAAEQIKVNIGDFGTKNPVASEPHGFPIRFFKANALKVYSEQNPRLGHFTYVFKQLIKYIIAARWFIVAGIRE